MGRVAAVIAGSTWLAAASASAQAPQPPAPGPTCEAEPAPAADAAAVAAFLRALEREAAKRRAARAEEVVPLDNRGHNQGPVPFPFSDLPAPEDR
jgi:hypothetical protein